jgi:FtsP/CotA-like multicopper oxidase with cupredoxin domain
LITRREVLVGSVALGASACGPVGEPEAAPESGDPPQRKLNRRCDQRLLRVVLPPEHRWVTPLVKPPPALLRPMVGANPPDGGPRVGAVKEWVAPEWFWRYDGDRTRQGATGPGEIDASAERRGDIYVGQGADGAPLTPRYVSMRAEDFVGSVVPGYLTRMLGYAATLEGEDPAARPEPTSPGPRFEVDLGQPLLVRVENAINPALHLEVSVHLHGGHTPAHSDGHANFMIKPGDKRDYYYPNPVPMTVSHQGGRWVPNRYAANGGPDWDFSETPGTMWYHDHAEDITAHNALMGLAGFCILRDDEERRWIDEGRVPAIERDIPLGLRDVCLVPVTDPADMDPEIAARVASEGLQGEARIHFDPFDHDGYLGNVWLVNGVASPVLTVPQGKYRFRLLGASLARFFDLRFVAVLRGGEGRRVPEDVTRSDISAPLRFLRIGKDSWVMPNAVSQERVLLSMAARADVVLDLKQSVVIGGRARDPSEYDVYLVSTLAQADGRGPGHGDNANDVGTRGWQGEPPQTREISEWLWLMKIAFERDDAGRVARVPDDEDAPLCVDGVALREHRSIIEELHEAGISAVDTSKIPRREFDFERGKGAWQVNGRFYDPAVQNDAPALWSTELWILRNKSGGWWHPIHIHLESHQQVFAQAREIGGTNVYVKDPLYPTPEGAGEARDIRPSTDVAVWNTRIKHDTTLLGPNTEVHVLMRYRTFQGPFVFHCHNLNHEDMRMMFQFDPRLEGGPATDVPTRPAYWFFTEEIP